jgi:F-type H+-transporting ATPase subunit b
MLVPNTILASGGALIDIDATLFIQFGIFVTIFLVLRSLLFRPAIRLIEARYAATQGAREQATSYNDEAAQFSKEIDERLGAIRKEAEAQREKMLGEAQQEEKSLISAARAQALETIEEARTALKAQTVTVSQILKEQTQTMADEAVTKVLGREI